MMGNQKEKRMNKYTYRDNSKPEKPIIFLCVASDILEADKLYEEKIGIDPAKQCFVGCVPEKIK
jgi:hypothetical protein